MVSFIVWETFFVSLFVKLYINLIVDHNWEEINQNEHFSSSKKWRQQNHNTWRGAYSTWSANSTWKASSMRNAYSTRIANLTRSAYSMWSAYSMQSDYLTGSTYSMGSAYSRKVPIIKFGNDKQLILAYHSHCNLFHIHCYIIFLYKMQNALIETTIEFPL